MTNKGGYQCIRAQLAYGFPQTADASTPTMINTGSTMAFYGTTTGSLGTYEQDTGCCHNMDTDANCKPTTKSGGATVAGKVYYKGAAANEPTTGIALTWKDDFILAS